MCYFGHVGCCRTTSSLRQSQLYGWNLDQQNMSAVDLNLGALSFYFFKALLY